MAKQNRGDPNARAGASPYPGTFLLALREAVAGLGWQVRRWQGDRVACVDAEGHEYVIGVANLYRRARRVDRSEWPALMVDFLSHITEAAQGESLPDSLTAAA